MTVIKQDPRVVKTQTNLRRALVYLMQHEKLENISVQKITKTANITRGTFYLHYRDKQDFVEAAMNGIIDQLFEHVLEKGTPREVTDGKILQTMSVSETFSYIEKNADVFTVLLSGQQNRYFYQQLYNRLTEVITNYAKGLGTDLEEIDVPPADPGRLYYLGAVGVDHPLVGWGVNLHTTLHDQQLGEDAQQLC